MEERKAFGARHLRKLGAVLPGRMAEALETLHLVFIVGTVVDDEIGVPHHFQRDRIVAAGNMLDVIDESDRAALPFDAVADGAARMVQHEGLDLDARMGVSA